MASSPDPPVPRSLDPPTPRPPRPSPLPAPDGWPDDVWDLVCAHGAAMCIQRATRRYFMLRHARHPRWGDLYAHLCRLGAWDRLRPFSGVRREWRLEPDSWLAARDLGALMQEAHAGLWGHRGRYGLLPAPAMAAHAA